MLSTSSATGLVLCLEKIHQESCMEIKVSLVVLEKNNVFVIGIWIGHILISVKQTLCLYCGLVTPLKAHSEVGPHPTIKIICA